MPPKEPEVPPGGSSHGASDEPHNDRPGAPKVDARAPGSGAVPGEQAAEPRVRPDETVAPATGGVGPEETELREEEQPVVVGTLFLMLIFLMMIAGFWAIVYIQLLER